MHTPTTKGFVTALQKACTGITRLLYWHYNTLVAPLQGALYRQVAYNLLANKHLITISFKMK